MKIFDTQMLEPKRSARLFMTDYLNTPRNGQFQDRLASGTRMGARTIKVGFWPPLDDGLLVKARLAVLRCGFTESYEGDSKIDNQKSNAIFGGNEQVVVDVEVKGMTDKHLVTVVIEGREMP